MRKTTVITVFLFLVFTSCSTAQKSNLEIAPNSSLELDYPNYKMYELQLKNSTGTALAVRVADKKTGEFVSGIGLGPLAKVEVVVGEGSKIVFTNNSSSMGKVSVKMLNTDVKLKVVTSTKNMISFTLINPSDESIPLIIPNVKNPHSSPNSSCGVDLKIGQALLFRNGHKKYVLLTVDENIKEGQEVDVYAILIKRKKELGLKK